MNQQNQTAPKVFTTIDGNSLMAQEYEPLRFAIDKILPHGIFVFAGSPKVGKSWLTLDMCYAISTGGKLWDFTAPQGYGKSYETQDFREAEAQSRGNTAADHHAADTKNADSRQAQNHQGENRHRRESEVCREPRA